MARAPLTGLSGAALADPLPGDAPPSQRNLMLALGISILVHALFLSLHFKFPEASRALRDKALDIVLVNSRSAGRPKDAQVLAQANLDGGGDTDKDVRAQTPLPPSPTQQSGSDLEHAQQRIRELESRQQRLLTQARSKATVAPRVAHEAQPDPTPTVSGRDLATTALAMARLEAEIGKNLDDYSKRPRKVQAQLRAREYPYAQYIEDWRQKIERVGTLNYPDSARGKVYGSLILTVGIRANGEVAYVEVERSSGHKVLDEAAKRIVQLAAPYPPLPDYIRRDADILDVTRTWFFTSGDKLQAQ